jgi:hypothetical protein
MCTDEKMPAGDGNPTAGHTDGAIVPGALGRIKAAIVRAASWLAIVLRGIA